MRPLGTEREWWKLGLIAFLPIAIFYDVHLRAALLSLFLGIAGFIWTVNVMWRSLASRSGWRVACLKAALPIMCFCSFPVTIVIGLGCQEVALSRAQELRLALLEKLPKEDLNKAYAELCGNKGCGILSYKIIPANAGELGEKGHLIVMLFNEHRATVDIESGKVTTSEYTY
jgi:hypothetical protein